MGREKSVVVSGSNSNQLTSDIARETVREENGVREVTREVIRQFKEISIGQSFLFKAFQIKTFSK